MAPRLTSGLVARAEIVARLAHQGQVDKGGAPYAEHLATVALLVGQMTTDDRARAVAWLHDTVEDTPLALYDLVELGFPPVVVDAVALLTHTHEHTHAEYIRKIRDAEGAAGITARIVKRADLVHNADPARDHGGMPLESLQARYRKAIAILVGTEP